MTLDEVAKALKLPKESVRQIELSALRKLRKPWRAEYLEEFVFSVIPEPAAIDHLTILKKREWSGASYEFTACFEDELLEDF